MIFKEPPLTKVIYHDLVSSSTLLSNDRHSTYTIELPIYLGLRLPPNSNSKNLILPLLLRQIPLHIPPVPLHNLLAQP